MYRINSDVNIKILPKSHIEYTPIIKSCSC